MRSEFNSLIVHAMPLGKNVSKNIKELYADNKKKGKERGANGKPRSRDQIIAISMHAAGKGRKGMGAKRQRMLMDTV